MLEVEIRIKGHLDRFRAGWFTGLTVNHDADGTTVLKGSIKDQAELRGVLNWLADLGIELISVTTESKMVPK